MPYSQPKIQANFVEHSSTARIRSSVLKSEWHQKVGLPFSKRNQNVPYDFKKRSPTERASDPPIKRHSRLGSKEN